MRNSYVASAVVVFVSLLRYVEIDDVTKDSFETIGEGKIEKAWKTENDTVIVITEEGGIWRRRKEDYEMIGREDEIEGIVPKTFRGHPRKPSCIGTPIIIAFEN